MISNFCYATLEGISSVKEFMITQGQAVLIGTGLMLGLLYAIRKRLRTKSQKYLDTRSEMAE